MAFGWIVVTIVTVAVAAAVAVALATRRRLRPLTKADRLRAARSAMKGLRAANRRSRKRPYLGRSDDASRLDRYSAGLAENATYHDAAGFSGGGDGGGDGGGGGPGSD